MATAGRKFSYYKGLSETNKRIYDRSDAITSIRLAGAERIMPYVASLEKSLLAEDRNATQNAADQLLAKLCQSFKVPPIRTKVLTRRPSESWGEMHGLYEAEEGKKPVITVWMRTAKRKQVVAFRTFLRTVIHEFVHHLDFSLLRLDESFHTEGFYKRESSLARSLLG